ncbi:MAG: hypothetical protein LIO46_06915 [Clostridiales bacterium]|nr:hypothetical protein [Clostridiales bacterium]
MFDKVQYAAKGSLSPCGCVFVFGRRQPAVIHILAMDKILSFAGFAFYETGRFLPTRKRVMARLKLREQNSPL